MPRNVGSFEQVLRIVFGLALLSLFFVGPKTAWGLLGIVPLLTGVVGYCPLYGALGFSTHRRTHHRNRAVQR